MADKSPEQMAHDAYWTTRGDHVFDWLLGVTEGDKKGWNPNVGTMATDATFNNGQ